MIRTVDYYFDIYDSKGNFKFRKKDVGRARIDFASLSALLYTAEVTMTEDKRIDYINDTLQISMNLNGKVSQLGRYLFSSPDRQINSKKAMRTLRCYSTLKILKDEKLEKTLVLEKGEHIGNTIKRLLGDKAHRVKDIDNRLMTQKIYAPGTELLEVINDLLTNTQYSRLLVDREGYYFIQNYILPPDREIEIVYKEGEALIVDDLTEELDYDIPNVFVMSTNSLDVNPPLTVVYKNQNASSPVSIQSRNGRKITEFNTVDDVTDLDILSERNKRLAYERTQTLSHVEMKTANNPEHWYLNCVYLKAYDINNRYIETSWSMDCVVGGKMEHTLRRAVQL